MWLVCTCVRAHVLGRMWVWRLEVDAEHFPQLFFIFCVEPASLAEPKAHQLALVSLASQPACPLS